jgi:hypothetical protein
MTTVADLIGSKVEEKFTEFDMTEVQNVLSKLSDIEPVDLAHAEMLQQQALRGADILSDYLGKIVKTVNYLESKINKVKNQVSLTYKDPEGGKVTSEMRKWAGESSPEVEELSIKLAEAKAAKVTLEKKYDVLIRTHHQYKDIAAGFRRTILGYNNNPQEKIPEGWQ